MEQLVVVIGIVLYLMMAVGYSRVEGPSTGWGRFFITRGIFFPIVAALAMAGCALFPRYFILDVRASLIEQYGEIDDE